MRSKEKRLVPKGERTWQSEVCTRVEAFSLCFWQDTVYRWRPVVEERDSLDSLNGYRGRGVKRQGEGRAQVGQPQNKRSDWVSREHVSGEQCRSDVGSDVRGECEKDWNVDINSVNDLRRREEGHIGEDYKAEEITSGKGRRTRLRSWKRTKDL